MAQQDRPQSASSACYEYTPLGNKEKISLTWEKFLDDKPIKNRKIFERYIPEIDTFLRLLKRNRINPYKRNVLLIFPTDKAKFKVFTCVGFGAFDEIGSYYDKHIAYGFGCFCRDRNAKEVSREAGVFCPGDFAYAASCHVRFDLSEKKRWYFIDRQDFCFSPSNWDHAGNDLLASRIYQIAFGSFFPGYLGQLAIESERHACNRQFVTRIKRTAHRWKEHPNKQIVQDYPSPYGTISVPHELMESYSNLAKVGAPKNLFEYFLHAIALDKATSNIEILKYWQHVEDDQDAGILDSEDVTKLAVIAWHCRNRICAALTK